MQAQTTTGDPQVTLNGRVIRSSIETFVFGTRVPKQATPAFGTLVKVSAANQKVTLVGVIYDIAVQENALTRMIARALSEDLRGEESALREQASVEGAVLCLGYLDAQGRAHYTFPAQPPWLLDEVLNCTDDEIRCFTSNPRFLVSIVRSRATGLPRSSLIVATIERAAQLHANRRAFIESCAEELARQLNDRPVELDDLLRDLEVLYE
ncbi:MAG: hypothetical protein ACK4WM_01670 [Thermoflexales bacterium]